MQRYILRRLILAVPTILGAVTLVFVIMRVLPGDPAAAFLSGGEAGFNVQAYEVVREQLGLNKPLIVQYGEWMGGLLRGDLGRSLLTNESIAAQMSRRGPITLEIAAMATLIGIGLGVPLGLVAAYRQDSLYDYGLRALAALGLAAPHFWVGILIILFGVRLFLWSPPIGYNPIWEDVGANLGQLIWPALVLGLGRLSAVGRMARSTMLDVLREDYVRTARAKGLAEPIVLVRHALRNALIPVVTLVGLSLALSIGGSVVMEVVFTVPGMGLMIVEAIEERDFPVVQAAITVLIVTLVLVNLLVDLLYSWLDPRIVYK